MLVCEDYMIYFMEMHRTEAEEKHGLDESYWERKLEMSEGEHRSTSTPNPFKY